MKRLLLVLVVACGGDSEVLEPVSCFTRTTKIANDACVIPVDGLARADGCVWVWESDGTQGNGLASECTDTGGETVTLRSSYAIGSRIGAVVEMDGFDGPTCAFVECQ